MPEENPDVSVLEPADTDALAAMLAIYRDAIDPSERKTEREIVGLVSRPDYRILILRERASVAGFAILYISQTARFWLLEYMAIGRDARSGGLGSYLFREVQRHATAEQPDFPLVLEVEQPQSASTPGNDPAARLRFYARFGCRKIDGLNYILPLEVSGIPPPMLLLASGLEGGETLPRSLVERWLVSLYVDVYRKTRHDARITTMMSKLTDPVRLEAI